MKALVAGIVLIIVLGVGGFFYRNVLEHPNTPIAGGTACTADAKLCPDGTAVGRTGPNCEFAECAAPNVSFDDAKIAFAVPDGYTDTTPSAVALPLVAKYAKTASSTPVATLIISDYSITGSSTADSVIMAHTTFEPSDMPATDMSKFTPVVVGLKTFSEVTIERNEGVVETAYFLARPTDVLEFDLIEHGVANWTDPDLIADNLPEHQAILKMLGTFEDTEPQPN